MKVAILGAGNVGRTLARSLSETSHDVTLRAMRSGLPRHGFADALLVLAVRDSVLPTVAKRLAASGAVSKRTAVVHVAGAVDASVLGDLRQKSAGVGQMHPMISFASHRKAPVLRGAHVLVAGDPVAVRRAKTISRALGMTPREWSRVERVAYHAAAGLVANGAVALAASGAVLMERAGAPRSALPRALGPLLRSVADNVERIGLPAALTGPVRRGDARAVRRHLERIDHVAPELRALYVASISAQLPLARDIGDATPVELDEVARVAERARRRR